MKLDITGKMANSNTVAEEYISSLSDLTVNSKPLINMLTMLAEENHEHAPAIVAAVEKHLQKVPSEIKLPVLYLIDSIVKNVGRDYIDLFTQNIVSTFCSVFEKVDERTRAQMFKLRQTWNEVFPPKKLYAVDLRVSCIDPAWPITAPPPTSIHVNPKFFAKQPVTAKPEPVVSAPIAIPSVPSFSLGVSEPRTASEIQMRDQLLMKQKELIELQQKKLTLESMQLTARLEEQQKQLQSGRVQATQHMLLTRPPVSQNTETSKLLEFMTVTSRQQQAGQPDASLLASKSRLPAAASGAPRSSTKIMQPKQITPASQLSSETAPAPTSSVRPVSRVRDPRLADRGLPASVMQDKPQSQLIFESVSKVEPAPSKAHITINLGCDNKNNVPNKERRGITKPRIMSTKARNNSKLSPPIVDVSKGQEASKSKVLQPSSSLSPSMKRIPRLKESNKAMLVELSSPNQKREDVKKNKDEVSPKVISPSKSISPKKKSLDKDKSPKSKSSDKSESPTKPSSKSGSPRKKPVDKKPSVPLNSDRTLGKVRDHSKERHKYELHSDGSSPSPPPPPVISDAQKQEDRSKFRDVKISSKGRNYVRRNRHPDSRSRSPVVSDVDLRLSGPPEKMQKMMSPEESVKKPLLDAALNVDSTKDVDLRQLPGKRASAEREGSDQPPAKKSKAEMFDVLFGNEDVDLRRLATSQLPQQPSPPPPPIISQLSPNGSEDSTPTKSDSKTFSPKSKSTDEHAGENGDVHPRDWSKFKGHKSPVAASPYRNRRGPKGSPGQFDRLGRPFVFQRSPGSHESRRFSPLSVDTDMRKRSKVDPLEAGDGNMHLMLAQAQDQLQSGQLTQKQYSTLVTSVIKMNEDKKLREAKRRDENWEPRRQRLDLSPVSDDGSLEQVPKFSPCSDTSEGTSRHSPPHPKNVDMEDRFRAGSRHHGPGPQGPRGPRFSSWARGHHPQQGWMHRPPGIRPMQPPFVRHAGGDGSYGWRPPRPPFVNQMPGPPGFSGDPRMFGPRPEHFESRGRIEQFDNQNEQFEPEYEPAQHPELPMADTTVLEHIANDTMRTINIDGVAREVRFYGETAITMVAWDEPREVIFQRGTRRVLFDDNESCVCAFNDVYRDCVLYGKPHKVRFGAPTRELFIDNKWYECYFGGPPISIEIDGKMRTVKLEGPPPQVKLGYAKRTDLCAGKINLIINATNMVPIYLDAKPQRFDIDNKPHVLRFVNALTTVLINGQPFDVEFGGLPKPIMVRNKKHFIRFSVLPRDVKPGYVNIRNMEGGRLPSPPHQPEDDEEVHNEEDESHDATLPVFSTGGRTTRRTGLQSKESSSSKNSPSTQDDDLVMPVTGVYINNKISSGSVTVPLEFLTSSLPTALAPVSGFGYQVEPESHSQDGSTFQKSSESTPSSTSDTTITAPVFNPFLPLNLNVGELFQKLVATGIVPLQNENEPITVTEVKKDEEVSAVKPINFDAVETLRVKQPGIVSALYSGIQCSSCGVRFPPEETVKYSQHLDWHFRQNRRDRDNTRKAQSRKWYYDVSDWIQFEEIEDLEHRAQSWFESQQEATSQVEDNEPVVIPSVPVGEDSENPFCEMCHDKFEQFYNEESEEWHLKLAIRVDDKIYHPLCYEDFKAASMNETSIETKDESKEEEVSLSKEEDETAVKEELVKDEPSEGMELQDTKIKIEMVDTKVEIREEPSDMDDVVVTDVVDVKSRLLPVEDLTMQEDVAEEESSEGETIVTAILDDVCESAELLLFGPREVKCEPDDELITIEDKPMIPEETLNTAADTTHVAVISSIDGNVQFEEGAVSAAAVVSSKIKINITKPLPVRESQPEVDSDATPGDNETETGISPISRHLGSDEDGEPPPPGVETLPEPAKLKPKLVGRQLTVLPPVNKGTDLSGLCSVM